MYIQWALFCNMPLGKKQCPHRQAGRYMVKETGLFSSFFFFSFFSILFPYKVFAKSKQVSVTVPLFQHHSNLVDCLGNSIGVKERRKQHVESLIQTMCHSPISVQHMLLPGEPYLTQTFFGLCRWKQYEACWRRPTLLECPTAGYVQWE